MSFPFLYIQHQQRALASSLEQSQEENENEEDNENASSTEKVQEETNEEENVAEDLAKEETAKEDSDDNKKSEEAKQEDLDDKPQENSGNDNKPDITQDSIEQNNENNTGDEKLGSEEESSAETSSKLELTNPEEESSSSENLQNKEKECLSPEKTDEEEESRSEDFYCSEDKGSEQSEKGLAIENKNETEAVNETEATSDTGGNEITNQEDSQGNEHNEEVLLEDNNKEEAGNSEEDTNNLLENKNEPASEENSTLNSTQESTLSTENPKTDSTGNQEEQSDSSIEENNNEENQKQKIETGEAIAQSDIFNELNVNITGENWKDVVINLYENHQEDVNLLEIINQIIENEYLSQEEVDTIVNNENLAIIENNASSSSNSGENKIGESDEESEINTGEALAEANIVNVINKNIVGNNWVFALINIFGNWEGDLIVPGEDLLKFQNMLSKNNIEINNLNEAGIENFSEAEANTGGNSIENSESANIQTGNASTQSDVFNQINNNIAESGWFSLKINNMGAWLGAIQDWDNDINNNLLFNYLIGAENTIEDDSQLEVNNNNYAQLTNTASAKANTGNNSITDSGNSSIKTSNASAFTNIANLVNLNFIGNNWVYTVVNIMGSWSGNLIFAYPDLEISISDHQETADPGSENVYKISYFNKGKAAAKDISVLVQLPEEVSSEYPGQKYHLPIQKLSPGQGASFEIETTIKPSEQITKNSLLAKAEITTDTTEKNTGNNKSVDQTTLNLASKDAPNQNDVINDKNNIISTDTPAKKSNNLLSYAFQQSQDNQLETELEITRKKTEGLTFSPNNIISHEITIENNGDNPVYDIKMEDTMNYLENGKLEIIEYEWEIGHLEKDAAVKVEYQVLINNTAPVGKHQFSAIAKGSDFKGDEVRSNKASMSFQVLPLQQPFYENSTETKQEKPPFELIKTTQASENESIPVLAASTQKPPLPLWIWISALVAYGLAINWAIFPYGNSNSQKQKLVRFTVGTSIFSALFFAFWFSYQSNDYLWVPLVALLILTLHLYYKYFSFPGFAPFSSLLKKYRL